MNKDMEEEIKGLEDHVDMLENSTLLSVSPLTEISIEKEMEIKLENEAEIKLAKEMKIENEEMEGTATGVVDGEEEEEGEGSEDKSVDNPYAYLDRNEFSSEKYKIEVKGLPKFFGFKELKKLLNNKLNLKSHKIKAGNGSAKGGFMFVSFKTEEDQQTALQVLNGYKWKSKTLRAEVAKGVEDPLVRKRAFKRDFEQIDKDATGFRPTTTTTGESIEDTMKRVTIPWYNVPYPEQLKRKMSAADAFACEMTKKILEVNPRLSEQVKESKMCVVEEIKASPVTENYRNKCEFSIGYHPETKEKMVGFRSSSYKAGSVAIGPIGHLSHLPVNMVKVALAFQEYIRSSNFQPFDPESHEGCWKNMTVRTTTSGQVMIILLISAKGLKLEQLTEIKRSLIEMFSSLVEPRIESMFLKTSESHGQQQKNLPTKLFGQDYITENLLGLQFRISSEAFFQINAPAAEILYTTVAGLLESNPCTTVLDVCCGTGTIGISVAAKCGQVLGIEMVESAVKDARQNAELNGMSDKCEFFAGKAEDVIDLVISKAKYENIVAIVDPPRSGLHQRVVLLLRKCDKIKTLIYISCDARQAMKNFVDLSRPISKTFRNSPYFPKQIIPIDMFPNCHQSELVICFERKEIL